MLKSISPSASTVFWNRHLLILIFWLLMMAQQIDLEAFVMNMQRKSPGSEFFILKIKDFLLQEIMDLIVAMEIILLFLTVMIGWRIER